VAFSRQRHRQGKLGGPAGTVRRIWQYDPETWKTGRPTNLGFLHRGVPHWTDGQAERILAGTHDAYLIAKVDVRLGPSTPMTYLHRGRQYIVMATGGGADAEIVALALPASGSTP